MFRYIEGAKEFSRLRVFKTIDIAERKGVIPPDHIYLNNYPIPHPLTAFNPALDIRDNRAVVYARIILGYFMYVSAIIRLEVPIPDIMSKGVTNNHYVAELIMTPSTRYDIWGIEDPRLVKHKDRSYMIYTGRTVNYFNPAIRRERTLPVLAVSERGLKWYKKAVFVLPSMFRRHVISDKDAFILDPGDGDVLLFHRPHTDDEKFYLLVSRIRRDDFVKAVESKGESVLEIEVDDPRIALEELDYEEKLGWATPPIEIEPGRFVTFVHAVDKYIYGYRIFAVQFRLRNGELELEAITPHYIMEPRESYEVFGDRPYTIFPCGAIKVDDQIIMTYGAADYMIGFAAIRVDELMSVLDKGRPS